MPPHNSLRGVFLILVTILIAACGGGGDSGGTSTAAPVPAAPTLTLATTSVAVGSSTTITWSSVNATSCTASGSWSGTLATSGSQTISPSAPGVSTYTLTCANAAGASKPSTTTLTAYLAATPYFSYSSSEYQYTSGVAAQAVSPQNVVDIVTWSITPALPAGLTFSTTTGAISGTPTATFPATNYLISGVGPGGMRSVNLTIGVTSHILLNLGHVNAVQFIQFDTAHVLSQDSSGYWILWDYVTTAQIASGTALLGSGSAATPPPLALAGPMVVIQTNTGLELRSSATGAVVAEIPVQLSWWKLATDGSYVCAGNTSQLSCWSPSGQSLFTKSGNYANANVFASPSALHVALGAAGNNIIETVSTASWTSSVGPVFQGTFYAWFVDGSSYLTMNAATAYVWEYSPATTLEGLVPPLTALTDGFCCPQLTGQGHWIWTLGYSPAVGVNEEAVTVYPLGNNPMSVGYYNLPTYLSNQISIAPIGTFIDEWPPQASNVLTAIDLSGATPVQTSYTMPFGAPTAFAAISPSQFMEGSSSGVLVDGSTPGAPRYFGYGVVTSIAGSAPRAVFSTASGSILSYNTTTNAFEPTIDLASTWQVDLSSDGSVLAAASPSVVNIYAMPSETLTSSLPGLVGPGLSSFTMSGDGSTLEEMANGVPARTLPSAGGPGTAKDVVFPMTPDLLNGPFPLSPDGTLAAISNTPGPVSFGTASTFIYKDGTLVATVNGWPVGWLSNNSLLVEVFNSTTYGGATIYSATGATLAAPPMGPLDSLQVVSSNLVYSPNAIVSLPSGATVWASGDPISGPPARAFIGSGGQLGAVAGSEVVFVSGNLVIAQPY